MLEVYFTYDVSLERSQDLERILIEHIFEHLSPKNLEDPSRPVVRITSSGGDVFNLLDPRIVEVNYFTINGEHLIQIVTGREKNRSYSTGTKFEILREVERPYIF